jgi:ATP-dependent Lon protease
LPWNKKSGGDEKEIDLKKVEGALDNRHYGLDEAKERIIEYLAVRKHAARRSGCASSRRRRASIR